MSLDENIKKLNELTEKMEKGDVGLDESVKLFEDGAVLVKLCLAELKEAKGRISILKQDIEKYTEEEFEI